MSRWGPMPLMCDGILSRRSGTANSASETQGKVLNMKREGLMSKILSRWITYYKKKTFLYTHHFQRNSGLKKKKLEVEIGWDKIQLVRSLSSFCPRLHSSLCCSYTAPSPAPFPCPSRSPSSPSRLSAHGPGNILLKDALGFHSIP